jgi:flagellum-specific ATP synthase
MTILQTQLQALDTIRTQEVIGSVAAVRGLSVLVDDLPLPVGTLVRVASPRESGASPAESRRGEIVGFDGARSIVMLYGAAAGLQPGARVLGEQSAQLVQVGPSLLGRVIDALGRPIDGGARPAETLPRPLMPPPTPALDRRRLIEPLPTGVRAIDAMLTIGRGQRVGVFSGPGVGKSTLLAMIARNTAADVNVIGLIGERGREVRQFLEEALGPEGLARSVVVVATGDESPLLRVRAAMLACAVAEHFRDAGRDVMLVMDSLTRFAHAQRQIGLTVGEQPATKGYTPSVFALLPVLIERAGAIEGGGSITGLYSILVEGDDLTEPISDATRGLLDGHITLARRLAMRGHFPAIDLLESVSRLADEVCDEHHIAARQSVLRLAAAYAQAEELIMIGAYARGSNPACDTAIALKSSIDAFLSQGILEKASYPNTCRALLELAAQAARHAAQPAAAARNVPPAGPAQPQHGTSLASAR